MKKPPCPQRGVAPSRTASSSLAKSRFLTNLSFVVFLFALDCVARAEPLQIKQLDHVVWTRKDGVPARITQLAPGADGTLWISSSSGLYHFDGMHFTLFASKLGDPAFPSGEVSTVYVSREDVVWVGLATVGIVSIKGGHVRLYGPTDGIPEGQVSQFSEAVDGTLWVIVRSKLFHFSGDQWIPEPTSRNGPSEDLWRMCFDKDGTQWIAAGQSIYRRPKGGVEFLPTGLKTQLVTGMVATPDGSVWVTNSTFTKEPGSVWRIGFGKSGYVQEFRTAAEGGFEPFLAFPESLWIGYSGGILAIVQASQAALRGRSPDKPLVSFDHFTQVDGLSGKYGFAGTRDSAGNLWIATERGLDRFRMPRLTKYIAVTPPFGTAVLASNRKGPMWIAGSDIPLISVDDGTTISHGPPRDYHAIYCDEKGVVWLESGDGLLQYIEGHFRHFAYPSEFASDAFPAHQFVGMDDHHLFVSVIRHGLWILTDDGTWSKVAYAGVPDHPPIAMYPQNHTTLWAGYIDGTIIRIEGQHVDTLPPPPVPLGSIQVFAASHAGLLVGSASGLSIIRDNAIQELHTDDAVSMRGVSGIVEARNGDIWTNGLAGVFHIPAGDLTAAARDPTYRLHAQPVLLNNTPLDAASQLYGLPTALSDAEGKVWFTNADVSYVDATKTTSDTPEPAISVRTVSSEVGSANSSSDPIFARPHTLRIGYFGTNLSDPDGVIYRYKLDRIDKDWQAVGSRTEAVYTDLPAGRYRFRVAASNRGEKWSDSPAQQEFTILPAFYQTIWFRTICFVLGAGLLCFLAALRTSYISARVRERSEERANERVRMARDLHDTLLQGVQALMWRFQIAAHELPEGSKTRGALDSALTSAETILSEARERVKSLRETPLETGDLAGALAQVGNELNWTGSVAFRVETRGKTYPLAPAVQEELFSVAREAITNSFRHSQASEITVEITFARRSVVLSCRDNGCGMSPDVLREGVAGHWGLLGMRERASKLRATLECWSTVGSGTEVLLTVPQRGFRYRRCCITGIRVS